ncbi:hypothetical protein A4A49_12933 [Nicotiana attenuata]|uniref:DUF7610 domain-containing protein n=1 Tax=Nicotiana attenuata TaxID=49451 RepID=A0A314KQN1_NICAT|nr:hypothetical protein A4A49_12933 [Nicotiana attenuata]
MTKRYAILRKKLQKLESDLNLLFTFSPDTATHEILSHDIEQQLVFLNHLLAAEIASCPSKPRHLHHIARRLDEVETAFRHWDDYHSQQSAAVHGNINDDVASVCSCSESCLNDDGEAAVADLSSPVNYDVPEEEDFPAGEMAEVKGVEEEDAVEIDGEEKGIWGNNIGRYIGILGCGMMIGAVCMGVVMVRFSSCFFVIQPLAFLTPT